MLLKYIFKNFKSFGEEVEFNMLPLDNNDPRFLKKIETIDREYHVLKRGVFFGPNASGKTNFIKSLYFIRNYILNEQNSGNIIKVDQFKANENQNSFFQFLIYLDKKIYDYGFTINNEQVVEEWLMSLEGNEFVALFERRTNKEGQTIIEIGEKLAATGTENRAIVELLKKTMKSDQKNILFLYKLFDNGIEEGKKIYNWFKRLQIIFPSTKGYVLPIASENFRKFSVKTLNKLDTGVHEIIQKTESIDLKKFISDNEIPEILEKDILATKNGIININGRFFLKMREQGKILMSEIKFKHSLNGESYEFKLEEESDGTRRILDFLPILFRVTNKDKNIYIIDELDRSLHTKITKFILEEFIKGINNESQIIFTSHDVNLINLNLFRKEEIWFVEKKNSGATKIRPFSDFVTKDGQNTLKDYLNGRFGGVPHIIDNIEEEIMANTKKGKTTDNTEEESC